MIIWYLFSTVLPSPSKHNEHDKNQWMNEEHTNSVNDSLSLGIHSLDCTPQCIDKRGQNISCYALVTCMLVYLICGSLSLYLPSQESIKSKYIIYAYGWK